MKLANKNSVEKICIALGFFDGFHLGHLFLLERVSSRVVKCRNRVVIAFREHPSPSKRPYILLPSERESLATLLGWKMFFLPDYFRNFTPEEFLDFLDAMKPVIVASGEDYRFGKGRAGDVELLKKRFGNKFFEVPPLYVDGRPVKSSWIKEEIVKGNIPLANFLLGYRFFISGSRVKGSGRGREMGFPTINIPHPDNKIKPPYGSYVALLNGVPAVAYFGTSPSVSLKESPVWEAHALDEEGLALIEGSSSFKIELISFIRREEKFSSVNFLVEAIRSDISHARSLFKILSSSSFEK